MKSVFLFVLASVFVIGCSEKESGNNDNLNQNAFEEEKTRLRVVTLGLGDMELVSEKYKEDQSLQPLDINQTDEKRLTEIFAVIEDNMKDNDGCEKLRKEDSDYDRYSGVEITGESCPLILSAETAVTVKESLIGTKDINSEKSVYYSLMSPDLLSKVDVQEYSGVSSLQSDTRVGDKAVTVSITHEGQGKGLSQSEGEFDYEFSITRLGTGGQGVSTVSTIDATYTFSFSDFKMVLTASMSQRDDEAAVKDYYVNGAATDRAEFSNLLGSLSMPEDLVQLNF